MIFYVFKPKNWKSVFEIDSIVKTIKQAIAQSNPNPL